MPLNKFEPIQQSVLDFAFKTLFSLNMPECMQ